MMQFQRWLARLIGKEDASQHKDEVLSNILSWNEETNMPLEWMVGDTILDTYEVTDILGEGGMGKVYKVHHRGWDVDLAVKTPRPEIFRLDQSQASFIQEAETWVNLGVHPNIVSCYYVRNMGGIPRVFAEYVEGGSLENSIENGRLYEGDQQTSLTRILDIAIQFAWGLHYAHEEGIIHQDVKPHNVMLTADGVTKVTDFGLARARAIAGELPSSEEGHSVLVSTGGMTPAYCSPEQAAGEQLSRKTDIWSWAVSMLEVFMGEVTWFNGQTAPQVLENYLKTGVQQSSIPAMPMKLVGLLQDCLQEEPANRPASTKVVSRLQEIYEECAGFEYGRVLTTAVELRADSLNNQALSLLDLGRLEDARQAWDMAQELDPLHIQTIYNYGLWRWQTGQQPDDMEFVQQLESAVLANRGNWRGHYLLGMLNMMQGDMTSAHKAVEQALQLSSGNGEVRALMETVQERKYSRCIQTYEYPLPIQTAACTPNNKYAIVAGGAGLHDDNTVFVWDLLSGEMRYKLRGHQFEVEHVFVTPDSEKVITCDRDTVQIWSLATGKCLRVIPDNDTDGIGTNIAMTPDGKYLVGRVSSDDVSFAYIRLLNIQNGRMVRKYFLKSQYVTCIAITPDGRHILGGHEHGDIGIWETLSGKLIKVLNGNAEIVSLVATGDGKRILSGNYDGSLDIWDWQNTKCLHIVAAHTDMIAQILTTPDHMRALTRSEREVKLWDLTGGTCLHTFELQKEYISEIAITPDGKFGLSGSTDHTVRVLDLEKGRSLHTFLHRNQIHAIAISADGEYLLAAESQPHLMYTQPPYYKMYLWSLMDIGKIEIPWEISRPLETQQLLHAEREARSLLDGAKLAISAGNATSAVDALRKVIAVPGFERDALWLDLWRQVGKTAPHVGLMHDRCILVIRHIDLQGFLQLACAADGRFAIVGGSGGHLRVWDLENGNCVHTLGDEESGNITGLALMPEERYLVVIRGYETLQLWDWRANHLINALAVESQLRLAITPNGKTAVTSMFSYEKLNFWEVTVATGSGQIKHVKSFGQSSTGSKGWFGSLAVSPDGKSATAGSDVGRLLMVNIQTGSAKVLLSKSKSSISSITFTPDGSHLLFGRDSMIQIWELFPRPKPVRYLVGHTGSVHSLAVTPDARYVISGSADCTVRLWDLMTCECIRVLQGHTSVVNAIQIISDGWKVVTASSDGTLRVWELDWDIG